MEQIEIFRAWRASERIHSVIFIRKHAARLLGLLEKRPAWPEDPLFGYFEAFPSFTVWLEATVAWINDVFIRADDGIDGGYSR